MLYVATTISVRIEIGEGIEATQMISEITYGNIQNSLAKGE